MTENLTLTLPGDLVARFRAHAEAMHTSVDVLVRGFIEEETGLAERRREARAWMADKARENMANDDLQGEDGWRWSREDCYSGPRFDRLNKI